MCPGRLRVMEHTRFFVVRSTQINKTEEGVVNIVSTKERKIWIERLIFYKMGLDLDAFSADLVLRWRGSLSLEILCETDNLLVSSVCSKQFPAAQRGKPVGENAAAYRHTATSRLDEGGNLDWGHPEPLLILLAQSSWQQRCWLDCPPCLHASQTTRSLLLGVYPPISWGPSPSMPLAVLALLAQLSGDISWLYWHQGWSPCCQAMARSSCCPDLLSVSAPGGSPSSPDGVLGAVLLWAGHPLLHQGPELARVEM